MFFLALQNLLWDNNTYLSASEVVLISPGEFWGPGNLSFKTAPWWFSCGWFYGWTPGVGGGQGGLVCCDLWGRKESDKTERLNWTELKGSRFPLMFSICGDISEQQRFNISQWRNGWIICLMLGHFDITRLLIVISPTLFVPKPPLRTEDSEPDV